MPNPYITTTNDPELLKLVQGYKAAVAAAKPLNDAVWELEPGTEAWYEARQKSDKASEALRNAETRLCAAFVWALEHQENGN